MENYQANHQHELSSLPFNYSLQMGMYYNDVISDGEKPYNVDRLRTFLHNINNKMPDKLRITIYETVGYPTLRILQYDGTDIIFTTREITREGTHYITFYGDQLITRIAINKNRKIQDFILLTYDKKEIAVFHENMGIINHNSRRRR